MLSPYQLDILYAMKANPGVTGDDDKGNDIDKDTCSSACFLEVKEEENQKETERHFNEQEDHPTENMNKRPPEEPASSLLILVPQSEQSSQYPKWLLDMGQTADWWSLWIGLFSFCLAFAVVYAVPAPSLDAKDDEQIEWYTKYVMPQPQLWSQNPLDAWDVYGIVGSLLLLVVLFLQYLVALKCMNKLGNDNKQMPALDYAKGFGFMSLLALLSFWIGRNVWCAKNGLGYAILSILFGMLISNLPIDLPDWLLRVAKDGEFFIKCSLVLLAVEFSVIGQFGWQSFVVAWVGSPLALVSGFFVGTRLFRMNAELALLVAVGATWCGASAISAVGAVLGSSASDISTSISVVAFFTVLFTFAQAYLAIGVGMDDRVAGAWIGGSVDQTGNVVASAAIVSEEAAEVAAIVKMVLNSGLGILATVIAFWWEVREQKAAAAAAQAIILESTIAITTDSEEDTEAAHIKNDKHHKHETETEPSKNPISLLLLWKNFPKFILGYLLCSGILTGVIPVMETSPASAAEAVAIMRAIHTLNKWWFAVAFVGIGIGTNVKKLWKSAVHSGVIKLYLVANAIDIGLALGLAYAVF